MAKEFAKSFYNSRQWKRCRASFIAYRTTIDGGLCQMCHENLGYIVDHKEELTPNNINDPEITMNHGNFQYLCLVCHNKKTFAGETGSNYFFDDNGQMQPLPP
jgi:5-methylcytosine-specific restriction protein A